MMFICFREQRVMALRLRGSKDVKKSFYYVWYLGAREAKGVDAMPGAIAYLLERERLQEPFKVTLQVSGTSHPEIPRGARRKCAADTNRPPVLSVADEPELAPSCSTLYFLFLFSPLIRVYLCA